MLTSIQYLKREVNLRERLILGIQLSADEYNTIVTLQETLVPKLN